ncbi:MAG: phosphohydrolase [Chloroflexi bacterium]|nr:phosphohydrolase [Chloroflexota bacterium]
MNPNSFEQAKQYAIHRLENELPSNLVYHNVSHTRDEVVPATARLAGMEGLRDKSLSLLLTAAWFHDLGYTEQPLHHELISARIALQILPGFGYNAEEVETIRWAILATALPQSPTTLLEEILVDADLDVLGRDDFSKRSNDLRRELALFGKVSADAEWHASQLKFLESHSYFTTSAHVLRDAGKQKNTADLKRILKELGMG